MERFQSKVESRYSKSLFLADMKCRDEKHSFIIVRRTHQQTIKYRGKKPLFYFFIFHSGKRRISPELTMNWIENSFFISFFSSFFFSFNCHCRRHLPSLKRDKKRDVPFLTSDNRHFCAKGPNKLFLFIKISKFRPSINVLNILPIWASLFSNYSFKKRVLGLVVIYNHQTNAEVFFTVYLLCGENL